MIKEESGRKITILKNRREISTVFADGRSYTNRLFILYKLPTEKTDSRIVFCVGRRSGTAVRRNRIRRRVKEAFFELAPSIQPGFDLVLIARGAVHQEKYMGIISSLKEILKKTGIYK